MRSLAITLLVLVAGATSATKVKRDPTHIGSSKPDTKARKLTKATVPSKKDTARCPPDTVKKTKKTDKKKLKQLARLKNAVDGKSAAKSTANRLASRMTKHHQKMSEQEIHKIIRSGDVAGLKRLAKNSRFLDLNKKAYKKFEDAHRLTTAMHIAVDYHDAEMVSALLKLGANPRVSDSFGWSPLHHAVANESPEIVSMLLDAAGDHETKLSKTTGSEMVEDSPDDDGVLSSIFQFWNSRGQHSENQRNWYRVVSPNGVAYRTGRDFHSRLKHEHAQAGVYHGAIVRTVNETDQWVQLTNGYYLPKYRNYPHDCMVPAPEQTPTEHSPNIHHTVEVSGFGSHASHPVKTKCTTKIVFLLEDQPQKEEL